MLHKVDKKNWATPKGRPGFLQQKIFAQKSISVKIANIMSFFKRRIAVIDVETTGLNPVKHEILEIGCLIAERQDDGDFKVLKEFECKVKPNRIEDAEEGALRVNGYNEADWMFAHTIEEALKELNEVAKGAVMVAHNLCFDHAFIDNAYRATGIESAMHYQKIDTLTYAVAKLDGDPDLSNWSLRALCEYYGVLNEKAHTAMADVRATYEVFRRMVGKKKK